MAQSCTYKFNGPDGKEVTIRGMAAMKAYLVDGGMEFFQTKGVRFEGLEKAEAKPAEQSGVLSAVSIPSISLRAAEGAFGGQSHNPERRGRDFVNGFRQDLINLATRFEKQYEAATPDQQQRFVDAFNSIAEQYAKVAGNYLSANSRVMSAMVTGSGNFPFRSNEKKADIADKRGREMMELLEGAPKRLQKALRGPVDDSPQSELQQAQAKLAEREAAQETMKKANALLRKNDDAGLRALGFSDDQIAELKKPDFAGRVGFPNYRLTNNNAEIRRLRGRVEELQSRVERVETEEAPKERTIGPGRIVENVAENRVQIFFDGKPSEEVRNALKSAAFRWAPSAGAWQRQLTPNAVYAAEQALNPFAGDTPSVLRATDADPSNQRITRAQADGFLSGFLAKYANAPQVTLVNTFDQLPATVQQEARNQGGNASDTKGVFHRGQVYLVAGNHSTVADFEATVFHEVIGHAGVRALFGDDFVKTANRLFMQLGGQAGLVKIMQRRGMGQQASDYIKGIAQAQRKELDQIRADMAAGKPGAQRRWNDAIARFVLTEEVFAHIAEQVKDRPSMMDKMKELIGKIRQWLRDKGFAELSNLGETDILFMLSKARQNMQGKDGGGITRNGVTVSGNDLMTSDGRRLNKDDPDYASAMRLADLLGLRQEPGVTTFSNRRSMDDMSDRNRVASEQAPNPAGDGKMGSAKPVVTIKSEKNTLGVKVDVGRNGRVSITWPGWGSTVGDLRSKALNAVMDAFRPQLPEGVFWRFTNNKNEAALAKRGELRVSTDHSSGNQEKGLSVTNGAHYSVFGYKYGYQVRGEVIGYGADGEPLLDVSNLEPMTKVMKSSDVVAEDRRLSSIELQKNGWTLEQFREISSNTFKIHDIDKDGPPNEPSAPVGSGVVPSTFRNEQGTIEVDGIQRPRTNSEGRPIHPTEDGIRNFWRWFKDSKVVDADGKPLVMYHGTKADFSAFEMRKAGTSDDGLAGKGFYFTYNPEEASGYAEGGNFGKGDAPNVQPVYVSLNNPLRIEKGVLPDGRRVMDVHKQYGHGINAKGGDAVRKLAEEAGHDGVVWVRTDGGVGHAVAFRPNQIKSATGNTGAFDPNEAPITLRRAPSATQQQGKGRIGAAVDSFLNGRNDMPEWLAQMPAETQEAARKAGIWTQQKPLAERLKDIRQNALKRLQQGLLDQFAPLKELGEREYVLARLTKSADAPLESLLLYGRPFMNDAGAIDVNLEKGGLIGALQDLNGEHDRFFAWIAGNRAEQLKKEGRENLFSDTDISALKDMNAGTMADGRNRKVVYESMLLKFNSYSKSVLDIAEKAGIIAKEDRAIWEKDFYVPFYRAMEDGEYKGPKNASGLVNQYAFKKLQGGTDNLNDLMQNTLRNWSHLLSASLKNQAAAAALTSAEKAGVAVPVSQKQKGSVSYLGRVKRKIPKGKTYTENGVQKVSDGTAEIETVGEKHFMVEDPFILDAITSLEWAGWNNPAMKWMQRAKHYLTLGVTISPTFKIRNLIRDQIAAIGLNPMSYNMMQNLSQGWKGTNKDSAEYAKMLAGGGLMRFGTFLEDDRAQHMKRLIDAGVEDSTILTSSEKVKAALGKAWDWWQEVGDRSENIARAAIYKQRFDQLVKEGKTQDEAHLLASFAARDSMDFSLQGQWGSIRFLTQLVPFLNARLQGLYKLGRDGVAPTVRLVTGNAEMGDKERAQRFGAVVGTVALASIALMLAYEDDEDWKNREEWDRDTYWWFKVGDTAYRIPKPFEIGAIGTLAERGLETAMNGFDKESRRIFVERLGAMLTGTFAMNPVPQLFKPLIDLYANTDSFTGRPIETMGMERLSKSERIGVGTSATAQLIGKATSLVGLSPVQVDHLIDGYFSWLGTHLAMTADFALRPMMGLPDQPARKWPDGYFVVGDFAKDLPANQSRYLTQFYEQSKEVQEAMADIRYYQSLGMTEKAMKLSQENKDEIQMYQAYSTAQRQIGEINKRIRMIQMSGKDAAVKRDEIDRLTQTRNNIAELTETRRAALQ